VGAITEKDQIEEVWKAIDNPNNHVVVQTAPAIRAALGECFGYPPGTLVTGKMAAALRLRLPPTRARMRPMNHLRADATVLTSAYMAAGMTSRARRPEFPRLAG
jgi:hypothetical protein